MGQSAQYHGVVGQSAQYHRWPSSQPLDSCVSKPYSLRVLIRRRTSQRGSRGGSALYQRHAHTGRHGGGHGRRRYDRAGGPHGLPTTHRGRRARCPALRLGSRRVTRGRTPPRRVSLVAAATSGSARFRSHAARRLKDDGARHVARDGSAMEPNPATGRGLNAKARNPGSASGSVLRAGDGNRTRMTSLEGHPMGVRCGPHPFVSRVWTLANRPECPRPRDGRAMGT